MKNLVYVLVLFLGASLTVGCNAQDCDHSKKMRAYQSTRLAIAAMNNPDATPDEVDEELCDGSGWIIQGDGHRTECPGCDACESTGDAPEIEWSTDTVLDAPQILEEFEIPIEKDVEPEPKVSQQPVKQKTKRGLFGRRK